MRSAATAAAPKLAAQRGGTILIVDDEDVVLRTGKLALQRLGFQVLMANSGYEALEQFRRCHSELALVILDMTMPGLSGDATLEELKSIDASVPVLGSSGFSADEARRRFGEAIAGFLPKPYTLQRLSEVVLAATASGEPAREQARSTYA